MDHDDLFGPDPHQLGNGDEFLIVGLGASAGGIQSLREFFSAVPADSDMAYVVVLHLSPDYDSHLAEVLQTAAAIPVHPVRARTKVEPNQVYVVSPNRSLTMVDGHLDVSEVTRIEERRAPIDIFFRTLAEVNRSRAVCVVLSGTGADGSMGMKRIKEFGGICLAQDPAEAEHSDMPRNSIATGLIDYVLPAREMPQRIMAYRNGLGTLAIEPEATPRNELDDNALRDIFTQLRIRTGHDFASYKRSTVLRRIARRMGVHEIKDIAGYASYFRQQPEEARALLKDLLISVTNFFRDAEAFRSLEALVVPQLFAGKGPEDHVRVWVAGCATGEEAYSVAMLLAEYAPDPISGPDIQVFATDIDDWALSKARSGYYTLNDAADVSPERLRRFFMKEGDGFRVRREIREMVLFAAHNVIKDPPFSHLDLITCRNLLIYLNRAAQQRIMEVFHFALNPGGYLFLGNSESSEGAGNLFVPVEKESHIFRSRPLETRVALPLPAAFNFPPSTISEPVEVQQQARRARERLSYQDLHLRLLEQFAPPSVIVNEEYEVLHLSENAGRYMHVGGGEPSNNLLNIVRPELRLELRTALIQAVQNRTSVEAREIPVAIEGKHEWVNLIVRPVLRDDNATQGFILVLFEEAAGTVDRPVAALRDTAEPIARQLEEELLRAKAQLRSTVQQHELQHEELKASNEELQAINEELRSSAEELETSKEELQSVNEELTTVNQELKIKIDELGQSNSNFKNLISSTDIGTIFLDRGLRISLFTPRAQDLFNLIAADVGRPLSDITNKLSDNIAVDAEQVLEKLQSVEREVRSRDGRWFIMRILPYRTPEDRIDGVVLTFMDISFRRQAEARQQRSEERLRLVIESISDYAIITMDADGVIDTWTSGAQAMFGYTPEEAIGQSAAIIFTEEDRTYQVPERELSTARTEGRALDERWHVRKDGSLIYASGVLALIQGQPAAGYVKVVRDLTQRKRQDEELRRIHEELEIRVAERTRELRSANEQLQAEVAERQRAEVARIELLRRLARVQEDERRRIARELHDEMGQLLAGLIMHLKPLEDNALEAAEVQERSRRARALADQISQEIHEVALQLRPTSLDDLGLQAALPQYVEAWSSRAGLPAQMHCHGFGAQRLPTTLETALYRVAQEALTNVARHAEASRVAVSLERRDGEVVLIVEDDGKGFDVEQTLKASNMEGRLGLTGMHERLAAVDGKMNIESARGQGTTVFATVPFTSQGPS